MLDAEPFEDAKRTAPDRAPWNILEDRATPVLAAFLKAAAESLENIFVLQGGENLDMVTVTA